MGEAKDEGGASGGRSLDGAVGLDAVNGGRGQQVGGTE